jgi:cysteinyl-tRNA synthetase, unknown class
MKLCTKTRRKSAHIPSLYPAMFTRRAFLASIVATAVAPASLAAKANPLKRVKSWMYLLQNLDDSKLITALAKTKYDMLVIEPGIDFKDGAYNAAAIVKKLRKKPDSTKRLLLAYIDIGQAEDFRTYWTSKWKPGILLDADPDGWTGDVGVAFWHPDWKKVWLGKSGMIAKLAALGFDGVYLDWIGIYQEPAAIAAAKKQHLDPAAEMVRFIGQIRSAKPGMLVVAQNATELISTPGYTSVIDALAVEDTWYRGRANAAWTSKGAGDVKPEGTETPAQKIVVYKRFQARGLPVFTIDYCVSKTNATRVYRESRAAKLIPLVTRVSLDHITTTPPG